MYDMEANDSFNLLEKNLDKLQMHNSGLDERKYYLLNNICNRQKVKPNQIRSMKKHLLHADQKAETRHKSVQNRRRTVNAQQLKQFHVNQNSVDPVDQALSSKYSKVNKMGRNVTIHVSKKFKRAKSTLKGKSMMTSSFKNKKNKNYGGTRVITKEQNPFPEAHSKNQRNSFFNQDYLYLAESTNPVNTIYDLDCNQPQFLVIEKRNQSGQQRKMNKFQNLDDSAAPIQTSKKRYFSYTKNRIKKKKLKQQAQRTKSAQKRQRRSSVKDKFAGKAVEFSKALKHHAKKQANLRALGLANVMYKFKNREKFRIENSRMKEQVLESYIMNNSMDQRTEKQKPNDLKNGFFIDEISIEQDLEDKFSESDANSQDMGSMSKFQRLSNLNLGNMNKVRERMSYATVDQAPKLFQKISKQKKKGKQRNNTMMLAQSQLQEIYDSPMASGRLKRGTFNEYGKG